MTDASTMTIRQMCDMFDVTPRALRFYEAKELLFPQRMGTKRLYGKADRARLTLILRGKRFGFSLEEIRQLLALYAQGKGKTTQIAKSIEVAERHLADMKSRRVALDDAIADLEELMERGRRALTRDTADQAA